MTIVGGGPVGLMLALFLDRHDVRSVVFNAESDVRRHPEATDATANAVGSAAA